MKSESEVFVNGNESQDLTLSEFQEECDKFTDLVVAVYHLDSRKFIYCSRSFARIFGYPPKNLIGSGLEIWYRYLNAAERPIIQKKLTNLLFRKFHNTGEKIRTSEYHVKNASGKWISIHHEICFQRFKNELVALNFIFDQTERELVDRYLDRNHRVYNGNNGISAVDKISDREKQVLKLIACGMPSKKIAKKLFISKHTVISHRKSLIKKFGVKNTAELIKEASKVIVL